MPEAVHSFDPARLLCDRAESLIDVGRPAEALPLLTRAVAVQPDLCRAYCLQSLALIKQEQYPAALRSAETAVRLEPANEWPHRLRAIVLLDTKKKREAVVSAREAVRLAPLETAALHTQVRCELAVGRRKEARAIADHLRGLAPEWSASHELLGLVALQERNPKAAEAHYREALRLNPNSWVAMNNLGLALQRQGKRKDAVERFHEAARLNPSKDLVRRNLSGAVRNYASAGGLGAIYVVAQLARILNSASRTPDGARYLPPGVVLAVMAVLICICIGCVVLNRRRMAELHPEVSQFYREESARNRRRLLRELPLWVGAVLFCGVSAVYSMAWISHGAVFAFGPAYHGAIIYTVSSLLAAGCMGGLGWNHWRRRPQP